MIRGTYSAADCRPHGHLIIAPHPSYLVTSLPHMSHFEMDINDPTAGLPCLSTLRVYEASDSTTSQDCTPPSLSFVLPPPVSDASTRAPFDGRVHFPSTTTATVTTTHEKPIACLVQQQVNFILLCSSASSKTERQLSVAARQRLTPTSTCSRATASSLLWTLRQTSSPRYSKILQTLLLHLLPFPMALCLTGSPRQSNTKELGVRVSTETNNPPCGKLSP